MSIRWTVPSKNFVLLGSHTQAQTFLETVYPYYPDCLVLTADKTYPVLEDAYNDAWQLWLNDKKLRIAVFGKNHFDTCPAPATDHICVMDMLMSHAEVGRYTDYNKQSRIKFEPAHVAMLLDHFFSQRGNKPGYSAGGGQQRQRYKKSKRSWTKNLL